MATGKTLDRPPGRDSSLTASYLALIRRFPPPIHSEAELERATAVINSLVDPDKLDAAEEDYLDVLSDESRVSGLLRVQPRIAPIF